MIPTLTTKTMSICGAANLLAAIFREDPQQVKAHLGLLPACPRCGLVVPLLPKYGLCSPCYRASFYIEVACSWCGKLTRRLTSEIVYYTSHQGYKHFFCNKLCWGHWFAATYGFGVHPENIGSAKRKFDWDMVWQKHLETGFGSLRLGRLLGMKTSTVGAILRMKRRETETLETMPRKGGDERWQKSS